MRVLEKLSAIQEELKAPKNLYNDFGGFNYRSCEDILQAVKPICKKHRTVLTLSDTIVEMNGRFYVKACAVLNDLDESDEITVFAYAREEESKKGMDGSQVTGASSSYARKYALNGLFCIDDVKDSDFTNQGDKPKAEPPKRKQWPDSVVEGQPKPQESKQDAVPCASCGKPVSGKVLDYSRNKFGKPLCMDCQKNAR